MGLHVAVIQAGLFQAAKQKPKTEDDAYVELMDNDESVTKTKGITAKKPASLKRGRLGRLHSGGPGSGWFADAGHIMHEKIGGQKGSNAGGLYKGKDGVARYVKQYDNKSQGRAEVVANTIYNDLGIGAPKAQIFGDGDFASDIIPGGTTLQDQGLTKSAAREVLRGFAADVLLANWDAVGLTYDNILMKDGKAHRIDNGATFTHRAQGAAKPNNLLYTDSEYTGFFNPKINNEYSKLAKVAGYSSADQIPDIKRQISNIVALEAKSGGWDNYLKAKAPYLTPQEHTTFAQMLSARTMALSNRHPSILQAGGQGSGWFAENGHVSHYTSTAHEAQFNSIGFALHHSASNKGDYYALKSKGQSGKYTGFTYHKDGSWKLGIIKPNGDLSAHKTVEGKSVKGKGLTSLLSALKEYGYSGPDTNKSVPMAPSVKKIEPAKTANKPVWNTPSPSQQAALDSAHKTFTEGDGYTYQKSEKSTSGSGAVNHIYTKPNPDAGGAFAKAIQENPYGTFNIINMGKSKENGDPLPAKKKADVTDTPTDKQLVDATYISHTPMLQKLGFQPKGMTKNADGQDEVLWNHPTSKLSVTSNTAQGKWKLFDKNGLPQSSGFGAEKLEQKVAQHTVTSGDVPKPAKPFWNYKGASGDYSSLDAYHTYITNNGYQYKKSDAPIIGGQITHTYENQYGQHKYLLENKNAEPGVLDDSTYHPVTQDNEQDSQEGIPKETKVVTDKAYRQKVADAVAEAMKSVPPDYNKKQHYYGDQSLMGYTKDGQMKIRMTAAKALGVPNHAIIQVQHDISNWTGSSHQKMRTANLKVIDGAKDADPAWIIEHEVTKQQLKKKYGDKLDLYRGIGSGGYKAAGIGKSQQDMENQIQAVRLLAQSAAPRWHVDLLSYGSDSWSQEESTSGGFASGGIKIHNPVIPVDYAITSHETNGNFGGGETEIVIAFPKGEIPVDKQTAVAASHQASDAVILGSIGLLRKYGWKIDVKGHNIRIHVIDPRYRELEAKKIITAGGPGSGRHKEFGTQEVPKNKFGKPILSERQKRALQNQVKAGTKEQRAADVGERLVRDAIGGKSIGTNSEPFDVLSKDGKHAIEVKTMLKQGNDKITMKSAAMERKYGWALKNKKQIHTVVLDMRGVSSTPKAVYYREGVGSFRMANMTPLTNGLKDINDAIHGRV